MPKVRATWGFLDGVGCRMASDLGIKVIIFGVDR